MLSTASEPFLDPVHTNPFLNENGAVLHRFQKRFASTHIVFVSFSPVHTTTPRCYALSAHGQMNSTHAHFNISAREIGAKLKPHGSVCPPFWALTVEWSGARSCQFWCRHRFQIASISPSTLNNSVFKSLHSGERFRMAPFSVIVFGVVVWTGP